MTTGARHFLWRFIPLVLFVAIVSVQLFGPHPIGVADNNDFPKVLGRIGIWAAPHFRGDLHDFYVTDYRIDDTHLWNSQIPTSELWLVQVAKQVCRLILPSGRFDMRVLGAVHALLATAAVWIMLGALQRFSWPFRIACTLILLLVFSDVEYVEFFSTAYMDAASMVFLMLVFAVSCSVAMDRSKAAWQWGLMFCAFGTAFLATKLQHQLCVVPLVIFSFTVMFQACDLRAKLAWGLTPGLFLATGIYMLAKTPKDYRVDSTFSLVFTKLLPLSPHPEAALEELGLPATDVVYSHLHAFSPASPLQDPEYRAKFLNQINSGKLLAFYIRHPQIPAHVLWADYLQFGPDIPVGNFGTMQRADSPTPVTRAKGLRIWSALRSELCLRWPSHIPILYLTLVLGSSAALCFGSGENRLIWCLVLVLSALGIASFAVGSLGDATETTRHIVLYQEATDMLVLLTLFSFGLSALTRASESARFSTSA